MQPSRILPDLQASLVCEDIRQEVTGNLILIGVVNFIRVPQVPITAARMLIFNRWAAGVGQFTQSVRLVAPDLTTVVARRDARFELPEPSAHAVNVTVLANVTFNAAGVYHVEVLVDDVMKLRYPLTLILTPPPNQTQTQTAPAPGEPTA
jgi:hypothetical protein